MKKVRLSFNGTVNALCIYHHSIMIYRYCMLPEFSCGAGVAQSVQRLATGWTTEGSEFESRYRQDFSPLQSVQTVGAHPASYPMGTEGSYPGGKAAGA
jgi:hypothetical protein